MLRQRREVQGQVASLDAKVTDLRVSTGGQCSGRQGIYRAHVGWKCMRKWQTRRWTEGQPVPAFQQRCVSSCPIVRGQRTLPLIRARGIAVRLVLHMDTYG